MFDLQAVYKVYSGVAGKCMCGCAGKYSYTQQGARDHNPGYEPEVNERSVKIITGKILRSSNAVVEDDCVYVDNGKRILVAYLSK